MPVSMRRAERGGFTLIELLLAVTLAVVLMVGLIGVIGALGRAEAKAEVKDGASQTGDAASTRSAAVAAMRLIEADLQQASAMGYKDGALSIVGYCGLDHTTLTPTHLPVTVVYRVEPLSGQRWLVRVQTDLDEPTNQNVRRQLVCRGVSAIKLTTPDATADGVGDPPDAPPVAAKTPVKNDEQQNAADPLAAVTSSLTLGRLPRRVEVQLIGEADQQPLVDQVVILR